MPVNQGQNAYSLGRDTQVVIVHPLAPGGQVDISNVTSFDAKQTYTALKAMPLSGNRLSAALPDGWTLSFSVDRNGPGLDNVVALVEAAWRTGGTIYSASVYQYINEPDGSSTTWHYTDVSLQFSDLGSWTTDAIVKQTVTGEANRRLAV